MGNIGNIALWLAIVIASYSVIASILGKTQRNSGLIQSSRYATYLTTIFIVISTISLVDAFLSNDFEFQYVFEHSNLAMPRIYTWVAFYAGNEGSLLFIATALSLLTTLAILFTPASFHKSLPYTNATMMVIIVFFLSVMAILANPFAKLPLIPIDGRGINPLLVHPGMFFHPPMLMTGLAMVSLPFAFSLGALISKQVGDEWVDMGRLWGIIAWATLGTGLLLGSWWAYTILGWGGYWAWDPVENAGFMPWLGLTAFVHSIMVQKRRGMFRMWNLALINITFGLALLGMFINRGGPVPSVHSFAQSTLGWIFLIFMITGIVVPFTIFFLRFNLLKSARNLESTLSREAAFLVNNLLLLAIAFVTLWGVIYPLISELFTGITITVGESFYNEVNGHIFLALIFLMGIGPLLPWRRTSMSTIKRNLIPPGLAGISISVVLLIAGIHKPYALIAFGLLGLVTFGIFIEWIKGARALINRGENPILACVKLIMSNRPRYGGYIVHLAIVSLALGIIGSSFYGIQRDIVLSEGQSATINDYRIKYASATTTLKPDRTEFSFKFDVFRGSSPVTNLTAERTYYPDFDMSSTIAGIHSTPVEDLYIVPGEIRDDNSVGFRIFVNPLMWWMWLAGPIMIVGALIALWPSKKPIVTGPNIINEPINKPRNANNES